MTLAWSLLAFLLLAVVLPLAWLIWRRRTDPMAGYSESEPQKGWPTEEGEA